LADSKYNGPAARTLSAARSDPPRPQDGTARAGGCIRRRPGRESPPKAKRANSPSCCSMSMTGSPASANAIALCRALMPLSASKAAADRHRRRSGASRRRAADQARPAWRRRDSNTRPTPSLKIRLTAASSMIHSIGARLTAPFEAAGPVRRDLTSSAEIRDSFRRVTDLRRPILTEITNWAY
jgi:hypothetical protein